MLNLVILQIDKKVQNQHIITFLIRNSRFQVSKICALLNTDNLLYLLHLPLQSKILKCKLN